MSPIHATVFSLILFSIARAARAGIVDDECAPIASTELKATPLHMAAFFGNVTEVERLVAVCSPNTPCGANYDLSLTPLHYAVFGEHPFVAGVLLAAGANATASAYVYATTPARIALLYNVSAVLKELPVPNSENIGVEKEMTLLDWDESVLVESILFKQLVNRIRAMVIRDIADHLGHDVFRQKNAGWLE